VWVIYSRWNIPFSIYLPLLARYVMKFFLCTNLFNFFVLKGKYFNFFTLVDIMRVEVGLDEAEGAPFFYQTLINLFKPIGYLMHQQV